MYTIGSNLEKLKYFCLIGMSGVGKSYWSRELAKEGYAIFSCDEYIFDQLKKKLTPEADFMVALAKWLGFPDSPTYQERAETYLYYENQSLEAAVDFYKNNSKAVIDSSGSLVLCNPELIQKLKSFGPLVYLQSDQSFYNRITENFVNNPKPVIWSDVYKEAANTRENFINLINYRTGLYDDYADLTISSNQFKNAKTAKDFLQLIEYGQTAAGIEINS